MSGVERFSRSNRHDEDEDKNGDRDEKRQPNN